MAEMLSPGVFIEEIDASTIVPTVSSSVGVFAGNFVKGPVGTYGLVTSVDELTTKYGKPTDKNYNDFYQAYNFLQYGNKLLVSRAANVGGTATEISGLIINETLDFTSETEPASETATFAVNDITNIAVGDFITTGSNTAVYKVISVDPNLITITVDRYLEDNIAMGDVINSWIQHTNAFVLIPKDGQAFYAENGLIDNIEIIENASDFELKNDSGAIGVDANASLRFIARNPGAWGNNITVTVALNGSFGTNAYALEDIALDDLFEYVPASDEIGIIISYGEDVVETYTVSLDESAKDHNNKSMFIETVINNQSSYVFVKANTTDIAEVTDTTLTYSNGSYVGTKATMVLGRDSSIQGDDLTSAYEVFNNKEELDIDIVIGNELNGDITAVQAVQNLVEARQDCIAFVGAYYSDTVGKKASDAVTALVTARKTGNFNINSMFMVFAGNYKYQYDRYNDKFRWINIAGDIAGLRAQTSTNRASWWASAGQIIPGSAA